MWKSLLRAASMVQARAVIAEVPRNVERMTQVVQPVSIGASQMNNFLTEMRGS